MRQFVLTTVIHAGIESAYDIICRPESYQSTIPEHYPSVRIMSVRGDTSVAEEHVMLGGREFSIMAKHVSSPPYRHETFVIGGDAKGSYILHELADASADKPDGGRVATPGGGRSTMLTTTVRMKTGRLSALSDARRGRLYQESFLCIIQDLVRASGCGATTCL